MPYRFCVPDLLYKRELDGEHGNRLATMSLDIVELSPAELARATGLRREIEVLSTPDMFAFSFAEARRWMLLTGDGALRKLANEHGIAMHGVLWIIEELHNSDFANA